MRKMRNRFVHLPLMCATIMLVLPLCAGAGQPGQAAIRTFTGEVTDSICAQSGSHNEMMAKMQSMGHDKKTCTMKCAELGAKYVLYDEADHAVYVLLEDQAKTEKFSGHRVHVSGVLQGNKINVISLDAIG